MGESTKAADTVDKLVRAVNGKFNGHTFDVWERTAQSVISMRHSGISDILEGRLYPEPKLIRPRPSSMGSRPSRVVTCSQAADKRTLSPGKKTQLKQQKMHSRTKGVLPCTRRIWYHHLQNILHTQSQHHFYGSRMTTFRNWKASRTGTATTVFSSTSCS